MTDAERKEILDHLRDFVRQQRKADDTADQGSLERAAEMMALYEDKAWVTELPAPKRLVSRGRPVDPESFSRFTRWLAEQTPLAGRTAYQLRDAHELRTNYLRQAQIKPEGERALRPLKWLTKNDYGERVPEVWKRAVILAGGETPDSPTVRKALAEWKHDNLPKVDRPSTRGKQGGAALAKRLIAEFDRLALEYPDQVAPTLDEIMAHLEGLMEEAAA